MSASASPSGICAAARCEKLESASTHVSVIADWRALGTTGFRTSLWKARTGSRRRRPEGLAGRPATRFWEVPCVDINAVGSFPVPIPFVKDDFFRSRSQTRAEREARRSLPEGWRRRSPAISEALWERSPQTGNTVSHSPPRNAAQDRLRVRQPLIGRTGTPVLRRCDPAAPDWIGMDVRRHPFGPV